jgi:hypothetical protein
MSHFVTTDQLAEKLKPTAFEQLLRAYMRCQMSTMTKPPIMIALYYIKHNDSFVWKLEPGTNTVTEGEILADCCAEHERRRTFTDRCKLLQIEGNVEPTTQA